MRKLIAILGCLALLSTLAVSSVSAAGMILFKDTFDSMDNDDWIWEASRYEVQDGKLVGGSTAVIHQTAYGTDHDVQRVFSSFTNKVDVTITDYDEAGVYEVGLWFRDYNYTWEQRDEEGMQDDGEVWTFLFNWATQTFTLESKDYFEANNIAEDAFTYTLPANTIKIGPDNEPTTFSMGWRIQPGKIECYYNDQKIITCTSCPADMGTIAPSPLLLVNSECYLEFDNFIVATADYNLFNESDTPAPTPDDNGGNGGNQGGNTPAPVVTEKVTQIVTDENGETRIEEQVVVVTPDTSNGGSSASNGGSNTGDMAVIVAAVMAVAALGAVVVVKRKEH